jgi:hypothetical protein
MKFGHARSLASVLLLLAAPAGSQEQSAALEGTVTDPSGGVVPGAAVEARSAAGPTVSATTDRLGVYRFPALPPGRWDVSTTVPGFRPARIEGIRLSLGKLLRVDLVLELGEVSERVDVRAESPLVDVRRSARFTSIRDEYVDKLPKGRDFTSLVTQAAGANWERKSGGLSIDGATEGENRTMIDGVETTHPFYGDSGLYLLTDFVEEVQVKSSGFAAEYGGATGGVVNVLTKSGTNAWRGSAWTYFRSDGLGYPFLDRWGTSWAPAYPDGRPSLRLDPKDPTRAEHVTYPKDDVAHWEPGFSLGGPLVRDKLWLFASYNPSFQTRDRTVTLAADGSVVSRRANNTTHNAAANLSAQLGTRTRARVAFGNGWGVSDGALPSLNGLDDPRALYDLRDSWPNWSLSGTLDHVRSDRLYLSVRAGYHYQDYHTEGAAQGPLYVFRTSNVGMAGVPGELQQTTGYTNVFTNYDIRKFQVTRLSLQGDVTWFVTAGGRHAFKAGVQYNRPGNVDDEGANGNQVNLYWDRSFLGKRGTYGYYNLLSNDIDPERGYLYYGDVHASNWAVFLQDAWTIADRLTLNMGLRAEHERVPSYATNPAVPKTAIEFSFGDKLAPRLGFAWDMKGDGRFKLFGSWGVFYDVMKLNMPWGSFGSSHALLYYMALDTPEWPTLVDAPGCPPDCPGELLLGPLELTNLVNDPENNLIDPDLEPYRLQEGTFGIEHALTPTLSVAARYVHKQVDRAVEDIGAMDAQRNAIYAIGNPGFGRATIAHVFADGTTVPYPKARRDYDAVELVLDKRLADRWALRTSYLWSRLQGTYTGLAQGDQNGYLSPNWGRVFDDPVMMFDERPEPIYGPLPTDRPHQLKAQLIYDLPFGTSVGLNGYLASGTPVTRVVAFLPPGSYPVQYLGRGSDGRTPTLSQLDLLLQHEFRLGGRKRLQVLANVLNVFNQQAVVTRYPFQLEPGAAVDVTEEEFFRGIDTQALIREQGLVGDPRFLMASELQAPREIRLGVRFLF